MMLSKGITLLAQAAMFNEEIRERRSQTTDHKTWTNFRSFFHRAHHENRKAVTTEGKRGYTTVVQNIFGVPPNSPEENHKAIDYISNIVQGMQMQSYDLERLAQVNAVLNRSNTSVMSQLEQMTVTMNDSQVQLKMIPSAPTNQTRSKRNYYCWSFGSNYNPGSKNFSSKKYFHQDEAYYNKILGGRKKGC